MANRRFPPPWTVEDKDVEAAFVVKDSTGHAYIYYEEERGPPISGEDANARRRAAERGEYRQAAGVSR